MTANQVPKTATTEDITAKLADSETFTYFGYGLESSSSAMMELLGHEAPSLAATATGRNLTLQKIDQVTTEAGPDGTPIKDALQQSFGQIATDDLSFYSMDKGLAEDTVSGRAYALTDDDMRALADWDFSGQWRNIEHLIPVVLEDGTKVNAISFVVRGNQDRAKTLDGSSYNPFLAGEEVAMGAIRAWREGYVRRS